MVNGAVFLNHGWVQRCFQILRWTVLLMLGLMVFVPNAMGQSAADTVIRRLVQEGRYDDALVMIDAELKRRANDSQLLLLKSASLSMTQRKPEAIKVLRAMIDKKIEPATAYNNLAVIYAAQGDYELAKTSLEWAVRIKPEYITAQHNLGNVYANLASQSYKQALQLDRSDRMLPAKLAQLSEVLGQSGSGAGAESRSSNNSLPPPVASANAAAASPGLSRTSSDAALEATWWGGKGN